MTFHPEKKILAAAAGLLALTVTAPAATAESSFADQLKKIHAGSSDSNLDRRDRTVLHYGVTTQEDIDKCTAEWEGKAYPAIDRGYDFPCPTAPITKADVDAAKAKTGFFAGLSS